MMGTNGDHELLAALEEERRKRPELEDTIGLHQELVEARAEVAAGVAHLKLDKQEVVKLMDQRVPLLHRWELQWDEQRFIRLAVRICDIAARHRQELASQFEEVRSLLNDDPDQRSNMVTGYLRGGKLEVPGRPVIDPEVLSFVLNNALHPFLKAHASVLTPLIENEKWYQRSCPVCGGEPDFGYLEEKVGGLRLLCSRCDTEWTYKRGECTFCGNSERETFAYYLGDDEVYRLYVCDRCKRYLKVMDGRQTRRKPMLPLERIVSIGMDVAARQQGYH
jgi:FdhE protein